MDIAEVLAMIVERACLYVPEASGSTNVKKPKRLTEELEYSKEALTPVETVFPKEALTRVEKVPVASVASDFVRFNRLISLFKAVSLPTCLVNLFCRCLMKI